ncbi:hypothetical protein D1007_05950 [Hordeum vulgare]|nr:hypothetical protein D1007_05950 [Hordeum vulgare]
MARLILSKNIKAVDIFISNQSPAFGSTTPRIKEIHRHIIEFIPGQGFKFGNLERIADTQDATSVDAVNIIKDVLSDLCGPKKTAEAEHVDPSAEYDDSIEDPLCSLQFNNLVVRVKKKFKRIVSKKRPVAVFTPRKCPHLVGKVARLSLGELAGSGGEASAVTPQRSPRVLAFPKPSPSIGSGLSRKYLLAARPVRSKSGPKLMEGAAKGEVDANCLNKTVYCSLKEVKVCANYLQPRHKARVVMLGFGCIFDLKIDSNISHPLMGHLYTNIDPSTMILEMGESNKKLHITSDSIHHLFGFPQGDSTPPTPLEDGSDDAIMRLKAKLGYKRSADIKTKYLRNILKDIVKDEKNDDLAL